MVLADRNEKAVRSAPATIKSLEVMLLGNESRIVQPNAAPWRIAVDGKARADK